MNDPRMRVLLFACALCACSQQRSAKDLATDAPDTTDLADDEAVSDTGLDPAQDTSWWEDADATDALDWQDPELADTRDADADEELLTEWPRPPGVGLMHTSQQLQTMWENRSFEPWSAAYSALMVEAQAALAHTASPMVDFYVPGYYVDEEAHTAAKQCITLDGMAAYVLALAYQLAEDDVERTEYADRAVQIIDAWATVNVSVSGDDGDLVMLYKGIHLVYAADLVLRYEGWDPAGRSALLSWVRSVFLGSAQAEKNDRNNHGDWGTLGAIAGGAILEDDVAVALELERIRVRISESIDDTGELPQENLRTNSGMWYTYFALAPMTAGIQVGKNILGVDLYGYVSPEGRSIRLALDRLFTYCLDPASWPHELPGGIAGEIWRVLYPCADEVEIPEPFDWPGNLYEIMSSVYAVPEWEAWTAPYRPQRGLHAWIHVTLMRGAY